MNAHICHIGVIDRAGKAHYITLTKGVNVITGRSSTGKSALIEIFDYCFGSSEFTVPVGVITDHAELYFVTMQVEQGFVALVRSEKLNGQGLILQAAELASVDPATFNSSTFSDASAFMPLKDYTRRLGRMMGLSITDVDEDLKDREFRRNKARKATPSVRSFTSFMLQHQNLVANKHALFYRFDEKEKRDQVIEHFMIFLGHVDGDYYQLMQRVNEKRRELDVLVRISLPQAKLLRENAERTVRFELDRYLAASGRDLNIGAWGEDPGNAIEMARKNEVQLDSLSAQHLEVRNKLEQERSRLMAERREIQQHLSLIAAAQNQVVEYRRKAQNVPTPAEGRDGQSYCVFCQTTHPALDQHANKLSQAIDWLNDELGKLRTLPVSLTEDRHSNERALTINADALNVVLERISVLDGQVNDLREQRTHLEIAMAAKLGVIAALKSMDESPVTPIEEKIEELKGEVERLEAEIKERYHVLDYRQRVERRIRELMKAIGDGFEFEASYRPINLHFSSETFELWHLAGNNEKVFLRSMGSGANWLSCHLTLFLALHRYFCELGKQCFIPPVLFFDQPSQVYFPPILDTDEEFSPERIGNREGKARVRAVNDDVKAVENLFSRLVEFCAQTKDKTAIEPQVIVTDHADNLTLHGEKQFGELVRAKWRGPNDGLIQIANQSESESLTPSRS